MKRNLSVALICILLLGSMVLPSAAAPAIYRYNEVIYTEMGPVEVETILTIHDSLTRSNTKKADVAQTVKYSGKVIAEVTLSATFGYDGKTSWVISASGAHTTYEGWSYGNESITTSGGTASLVAKLTHAVHGSRSVSISLTCSPTGQIS